MKAYLAPVLLVVWAVWSIVADDLTAVWLLLLTVAVLVQAEHLWRRYRDE